MTDEFEAVTTCQTLAQIDALLDAVDHEQRRLLGDRESLEAVRAALRVTARCQSLLQRLLAEAEHSQAATTAYGTSLTTWLAAVENLTPREATAQLRAGQDAAQFPAIERAALGGDVLPQQARAITRVLAGLPEELPAESLRAAETQLIGFAATHNSTELGHLSRHLLEVVAPEIAEEAEARRLEREFGEAFRNRHLSFLKDGHGSVLIRGSLPNADAEAFQRLVDAYAAQLKRGLEALDRREPIPSRGQRRSDGLMAMVRHHQQTTSCPGGPAGLRRFRTW